MIASRSLYVAVAEHEIHLTEWGEADAPALVMWHGLGRTGRDFDTAAAHFADRYRVICPDTIGRGLSSWSSRPEEDYVVPAYCGHAAALLDELGIDRCLWVGTSMGGLIGMALAADPRQGGRIRRLVMNDVGPAINPAAVERINSYVSIVPEYGGMAEFEQSLRAIYAPFGVLSDQEWRTMAETSMRRLPNGNITYHYDPEVMRVFCERFENREAWDLWDAVRCPVLAVRGAESDLLLPLTVEEMGRRGPCAQTLVVPGCGHAPMLNAPEQLLPLAAFLDAG